MKPGKLPKFNAHFERLLHEWFPWKPERDRVRAIYASSPLLALLLKGE